MGNTYASTAHRLIAMATLAAATNAIAAVQTYSDEAEFIAQTAAAGPYSAPFIGVSTSVLIADGLITATPGPGVPNLGVGNVLYIGLPSSLMTDGMSESDMDFSFSSSASAFGFTVANATGTSYLPGDSTFAVTWFDGSTELGKTQFVSPGTGSVFFGIRSTESFTRISLREVIGGPENATIYGGFADREFFGKFYLALASPIPEPTSWLLMALGCTALMLVAKRKSAP